MQQSTDSLIRQHMAYISQHAEELKQFDTIYDHMYYYFTAMLEIDESEAIRVIDDFRSDMMLSV